MTAGASKRPPNRTLIDRVRDTIVVRIDAKSVIAAITGQVSALMQNASGTISASNPLHSRIGDGTRQVSVDAGGCLPVVQEAKYRQNIGRHFIFTHYAADVDIAGPKLVRFTTPASPVKQYHWTVVVAASGGCKVELLENPTLNAAGSAGAEVPTNREGTPAAPTGTAFYDTTLTGDGTVLYTAHMTAGEHRIGDWRLKVNEDYVLRVTAGADNTIVSVTLDWFEV